MFVSYNLEDFGNELKKIRKSLGYSQPDVQALVGVSADSIRRIESGSVVPRYDTLELLSVAYKEDLLELLKSCRSNKFLMDYNDDLDYIITSYDKAAAASLKDKLLSDFYQDTQLSMVNPNELKQFVMFVDAIDQYYSCIPSTNEGAKVDLINALQLTIPNYKIKRFKRYKYNYIEFRLLLFISLFIAKDKDFAFSNEILYFILAKISDKNYSTKYIDFLTINVYFNIAYNYHMLDNHVKVIEIADAGITFCLEKRTSHALFSLYYRKGIAQFNLGDGKYLDSITTAFYILKAIRIPKLLEEYAKITRDKYGISVPLTNPVPPDVSSPIHNA